MSLPPLPDTSYMLYIPAAPYEPEWYTNSYGYDEEAMRAYGEACAAAERELCIEAVKRLLYMDWEGNVLKNGPREYANVEILRCVSAIRKSSQCRSDAAQSLRAHDAK